ncbi:MAG TPA: hypothetical protein VMM92_15745 [Thermoanaerobaculia bacterium]|nr:hypothetical protein [Thermoanaerobaculia bacterium]
MPAEPALVARLRSVPAEHPEVELAVLFGSRARPWFERMRDAYLKRLAEGGRG